MDTVIEAFLSWQFLFFCLAIGAVVFVIRQIAEYWMKNWWPLKQWKAANKQAKLWRDLILPILPILLGQAAALLATGYPYPEGFSTLSGRIAFGLVAGFTSGLVVRLFKSFFAGKMAEYGEKVNAFLSSKPSKKRERAQEDEDPGAQVRDTIKKDDQ